MTSRLITSFLRKTELFAELRYAPDETYINNKQRRITINKDAPALSLSHTMGFRNVLGGDYNYNLTEAKKDLQTFLAEQLGKG